MVFHLIVFVWSIQNYVLLYIKRQKVSNSNKFKWFDSANIRRAGRSYFKETNSEQLLKLQASKSQNFCKKKCLKKNFWKSLAYLRSQILEPLIKEQASKTRTCFECTTLNVHCNWQLPNYFLPQHTHMHSYMQVCL